MAGSRTWASACVSARAARRTATSCTSISRSRSTAAATSAACSSSWRRNRTSEKSRYLNDLPDRRARGQPIKRAIDVFEPDPLAQQLVDRQAACAIPLDVLRNVALGHAAPQVTALERAFLGDERDV